MSGSELYQKYLMELLLLDFEDLIDVERLSYEEFIETIREFR